MNCYRFLLNKLVHFERTAKPRLLPPPPPTFTNTRSIEHIPQTNKHILKSNDVPPPPLLKKDAHHSPKIQSSRPTVLKSNLSRGSLKNEKPATAGVVKSLPVPKVRSLVMSGSSESENSDSEREEGVLKIVSQATSSKVKKFKAHIKKSAPIIKRSAEDGDEQLELAMRSGKVRRLHPIPVNEDGMLVDTREHTCLHTHTHTHMSVCMTCTHTQALRSSQ